MAMNNVFTLNVDIKEATYVYDRKVTANDTTTFIVNLTNEGLPLDLSSVTNVTLANTRLDQVTVVTPGTKTGPSQVTFNLGQNETKTAGRVWAVVQLYDADGRVSTLGFNYTVVTDPTGDSYVPAGDELTLIQVVLGDGPLVIEQARQATANANTAADNAELATLHAQTAADNTNTAISNANTATQNAITATTNANNATSAANTATTNANNATSAANTAKTNADTATANANNAATNANTAASNAGNAASTANTAATNANNTATTINNDMKITHKGTVATYAGLPTSGQQVGDTWVVTTDGTPANNGVWRWQSNSTWLKINNLNLSGAETVSNVGVVAKATAEIARQTVMSGVVDWNGTNNTYYGNPSTTPKGSYAVVDSTYFSRNDSLRLYRTQALLNGYKVDINGFSNSVNVLASSALANNLNEIQLQPPPTFGTREDLVFLEAWFPSTGNGYELSWRIRTVAGVDFGKFAEGLGYWDNSKSSDICAQGGNAQPLTTAINYNPVFKSPDGRNQSVYSEINGFKGDLGLYVAGTGVSADKTALQTLDGYVYAIPLFRVKRRNSGGYSVTNLNGARDYYSVTISVTNGSNTATVSSGLSNIQIGDTLNYAAWNERRKVLSISGSTITFDQNATYTGTLGAFNISDRPDSLYSNIIDATDIIDLRHKVSLTGFNYQQLLEENFDKLLRGELTTKDTKTLAKEQFNLKKAPLGLAQDLQAVPTKRPFNLTKSDGTQQALVNLLGDWGNMEGSNLTAWDGNANTLGNPSADTNFKYGTQGAKITLTGTSGYFRKNFPVTSGNYYVVVADLKNNDATNVKIGLDTGASSLITSTSFTTAYFKYQATSTTTYSLSVTVTGVSGQSATVDGIRIYQIDQATYNLIDVDANWTGASNIATKFPYVDSSVQNVQLKNLVGVDGSFEYSLGSWSTNAGTVTIDSSKSIVGTKSAKLATTGDYIYKDIANLNSNSYYLIFAYSMSDMSNMTLNVWDYGAWTNRVQTTFGNTNGQWSAKYLKVSGKSGFRISLGCHTGNTSANIWVDGVRIYEIDQATYNLIDVDPNYTGGDKIAALFPYVDSPVNFVENLYDRFNNPIMNGDWTTSTSTWNSSGATVITRNQIPVKSSTIYSLNSGLAGNALIIKEWDSSNVFVKETPFGQTSKLSFTTQSTTKFITVQWNSVSQTQSNYDILMNSLQIEEGSSYNAYVPYGRYYLSYDYALNQTKTYLTESFNQHRQTFSDAQTSETVTDRVEALMTPQKHISVTQATPGQWAVNDTIKITSYNGVVSGVVDADTAVAVSDSLVSGGNPGSTSVVFKLRSLPSSMIVGDTMRLMYNDGSVSGITYTVSSIDSTTNNITFTTTALPATLNSSAVPNGLFVEDTASSSLPTVTATGIAGTWSGLGTKTATYTITTAPTTNTTDILVKYGVNYPAGKGIVNVPTNVDMAEVNGQKLVTGGTVSVKANFDGKVSGSTDLVPHYYNYNQYNSLLVPNSASWGGEPGTSNYAQISALDGTSQNQANTTNGNYSQMIFKFDLIRLIEDKYGETAFVGCVTVADKVAWLKANVSQVTADWYGYGSKPNGNNASFTVWGVGGSTWYPTVTHANSTVTKLTKSLSSGAVFNDCIDSNGQIYFLAYADASDGVTASTIYTDYVELSVTLNTAETGYTVFQPENLFPVLSENILTANQAFPVDTSGYDNGNYANSTVSMDSDGVKSVITADVSNKGALRFSSSISKNLYSTMYVEFKADAGKVVKVGGWRSVVGWLNSTTLTATGDWQSVVIVLPSSPNAGSDSIVLYIENGNVNTSNVIKIRKASLVKGSVSNLTWTSGRNKTKVLNFLGKVAGSEVENAHRAGARSGILLTTLPSMTDTNNVMLFSQGKYDNVTKLDGVVRNDTASGSGQYAQHLFEFDLSHLGLSYSELLKVIRQIMITYTGYGSGSNAGVQQYGTTGAIWNPATQSWSSTASQNTTGSTPTTTNPNWSTQYTPNFNTVVDKNMKVYWLVRSTYPADSTITSNIYTDYIKLEIQLSDQVDYQKANIIKVRPETKEIKTMFPTVTYRMPHNGGREDRISLWYRYLPYQGLGDSNTYNLLLSPDSGYVTKAGTGGVGSVNTANIDRSFLVKCITQNLPIGSSSATKDYLLSLTDYESFLRDVPYWYKSGSSNTYVYTKTFTSITPNSVNTSGRGFNHPRIVEGGVDWQYLAVGVDPKWSGYMFALPYLTTRNGELFIIAMTGLVDSNGMVFINGSGLNGGIDEFKIPGRPLIKGA